MQIGRGIGNGRDKIADRPTIDSVRQLTLAEVAGLERATNTNPVRQLRDSHHMAARLCAMGLKPGEVASETGYSLGRISTLFADPSFQELISHYRGVVDEAFAERQDEYFETVSANRRIAARLINDKLNDTDPEDISFRDLVLIHGDSADRTGYPKRTMALNVNADFAALLDKAVQRSNSAKLIEASPEPESISDPVKKSA